MSSYQQQQSTTSNPAHPVSGTRSNNMTKKKEIYTYELQYTLYGMSWSCRRDQPFRLAVGSFIEEYNNKVEIVQYSKETNNFQKVAQFDHPYPTTKIMWLPDASPSKPDLLATTGDYLRLWQFNEQTNTVEKKLCLNKTKNSEFCAPLTSFDWNMSDTNIIGTSSIDTTCTIWDINVEKSIASTSSGSGGSNITPKTQLIAHDKEVYDIAFARGKDVFASVGADGSVRMFDQRRLDHSNIIYETPGLTPLLRLCWNRQEPNYLATFAMDSNKVTILDIRVPAIPAAELVGHQAVINSIAWAPHSSCHICSAGDDSQALIWDISPMPNQIEDPILAYNAEAPINNLQWSTLHPDWVACNFDKKLQILRV